MTSEGDVSGVASYFQPAIKSIVSVLTSGRSYFDIVGSSLIAVAFPFGITAVELDPIVVSLIPLIRVSLNDSEFPLRDYEVIVFYYLRSPLVFLTFLPISAAILSSIICCISDVVPFGVYDYNLGSAGFCVLESAEPGEGFGG